MKLTSTDKHKHLYLEYADEKIVDEDGIIELLEL